MKDNKAIIAKGLYHYAQTEGAVTVKEYIIEEKDGKRCLFLRCQNEIDATVDRVELLITEKDSLGRTLGRKKLREKGFSVKAGECFSLPRGIVVSPGCVDFKVSFIEAGSGYYTYRERNRRVGVYYSPRRVRPEFSLGSSPKRSVTSRKKSRAVGTAVLLLSLMVVSVGLTVFGSYNSYYERKHGETFVDHMLPDIDLSGVGEWIGDLFWNIGDFLEDMVDRF